MMHYDDDFILIKL